MVFWGYFEFFFTLIDYFWVAVRAKKYLWGHLLQTDNFHFIRVFLFSECLGSLLGPIVLFGVILSLCWAYWDIFGGGQGLKTFLGFMYIG